MQNGLPFSILVVDDDEDDRMVIDEAFMAIGYGAEVRKFIDSRALLDYMEQIDASLYPSLIVLDNTLPGLDASETLRILKRNPSYKDIPVVVYTTLLTTDKKQQLAAAGAYASIVKGSTMQDVIGIAKDLRDIAEKGNRGALRS